jgi:hypothetical protein
LAETPHFLGRAVVALAQRSAWKKDFNTRFDAQRVTIENTVRVPEPCVPGYWIP